MLLNDSQKEAIRSKLTILHNELSRDITIFQAEKILFISTDDSYSGAYKHSLSQKKVVYTENNVKARIYYNNTDFNSLNTLDSNIHANLVDGKCVVRVDKEGYELLKNAEKVIIDGKEMTLTSSSKPVGNGVFNGLFWDFILSPDTSEV